MLLASTAWLPACDRPVRTPAVPTAATKASRLTATKFVAFGDNITEGFVQHCPGTFGGVMSQVSSRFGVLFAQGRAQPSPTAYPARLQAMLAERYPAQSVSVINEGAGGEQIEASVEALPRILTADAPDVLLLQHGINTINASHAAAIPTVVSNLRYMVQVARSRGIPVFVGTLLPERPGGCRAYDYADDKDDIIPANVQIRAMVGTEGAVLVDLYQAFNGQTALLIGEDGLHPSAAGYRAIAETYLAAIVNRLED